MEQRQAGGADVRQQSIGVLAAGDEHDFHRQLACQLVEMRLVQHVVPAETGDRAKRGTPGRPSDDAFRSSHW